MDRPLRPPFRRMTSELDPGQATRLLEKMQAGDPSAADELIPLLYGELRKVAEHCMDRQAADHTLQPTALVNEVWVRIASSKAPPRWENRAHFLRAAARTMRHVLVDHARAKRTAKRGEGHERVPLDHVLESFSESSIDVVDLNDALEELSAVDPELAKIVELRFFAGITVEEVASVLDVSERTVHRGWKVAQVWLRDKMA